MTFGGVALKFTQTGLRVLQFCSAVIILGIFSYFLAILTNHHLPIATYIRAVEGISGAAALYAVFAVLLTFFLGGYAFFAVLAIFLDLAFAACFLAVAVLTRGGAGKCEGDVKTPLGNGNTASGTVGFGSGGFGNDQNEAITYLPSLRRSCQLESAVFAISIVLAFLYLITLCFQILLVKHHRKEALHKTSQSTSLGSRSPKWKFWQRKTQRNTLSTV